MSTGITCEGLTTTEQEKVSRLAVDIRERFAPTKVVGCHAVGPIGNRALCFTRPSGQLSGCVAADGFLGTPDAKAVGLMTVWHD